MGRGPTRARRRSPRPDGPRTIWPLFALVLIACGDASLAPDAEVDAGQDGLHDAEIEAPDTGAADATGPDAEVDAGPANQAPAILGLTAEPLEGLVPLTATVTWSALDPEGDPLSCALRIDDLPQPAWGPAPCAATATATVTLSAPGAHLLRLRVEDGRGGAAEAEVTVRAERPFTLPVYLDADFALAGARVPEPRDVTCRVPVTASPGDDVGAALQAASTDAAARAPPGGHCVVTLPAGTFRLTAPVYLRDGVVIQGAGAEQTVVQAHLPTASPVFAAVGGAAAFAELGEVTRGDKGARRLTVSATAAAAAAALLAEGPVYGEVSVENDPAKFPPEWAQDYAAFGIGQVFRVIAVEGDALVLDRRLNEPYLTRARRLELRGAAQVVERAGLADLRVVRLDAHHAGTVLFDRTADAFLLRVWLEKTGWAHVHLDRSLACTIRQSYLFDAHDFGDGGQGYGVNLRQHTTGCLVEDNALRRLRHAVLLQLGANGNVVAYNAAEDARDNLGWLKADISLHGHYTHMNLIEGNDVEKIHVSDWWGPAPYHTVFANRVSRGGITVDDRSEDCAVVDNDAQANFPLEEDLRVDGSVQAILCVHNHGPDGAPLASRHRDCDDENDPAVVHERPRPASFYRASSLRRPDGQLPAALRLASPHPVPLPP